MNNKNEALKMARNGFIKIGNDDEITFQILQICVENKKRIEEALEQPAQGKINKELLFRTVDGVLDNNLPDGAHFQMTVDAIKKHKKNHNVVGDDYDLAAEYFRGNWR